MVFNSYLFILYFMPLAVILYHLLNKFQKFTLSKLLIIGGSLLFAGYADLQSVIFLIVSMAITYLCAYIQRKCSHSKTISKLLVALGIIINVFILGYYKYTHFIIDNINKQFAAEFSIDEIIVPLGISFITFQQIAFLVDNYREKIEKLVLVDYIFYITYFPKLIQGPITKYNDLITPLNDKDTRAFNSDNLAEGLWLFASGLARKVLLADVLAKAVSWGYGASIDHMTSIDALLVSLCFTFQIYFDFSGYSHMAAGVSKMLNLNLPANFDSPYQSKSIQEFWKKWHISLTDFLREYLYFPLGGSKKGKVRTYINTMIIFVVSGLWHGAAWTYIVWGALHGFASCLNRLFHKQWERLNDIFRWILTFSFVNTAWIFFRALSVSQAMDVIRKITRMENTTISDGLIECFKIPEITYLSGKFKGFALFLSNYRGIELMVFLILSLILSLNIKDHYNDKFKPTITKSILTIVFFTWSIVSLSTIVEFIYGSF